MQIKDFIPPILLDIVKRLRKVNYGLQHSTYSSYHDAIMACNTGGYNNDYLTDIVFAKTKQIRDNIFKHKTITLDYKASRLLLILSTLAIENNSLNIVDFGGSCGIHYFIVKRFFNNKLNLKWHIVETPVMVRKGKLLEDSGLRFFDNLEEAVSPLGNIDLIISSGAVQYVPDPLATLRDILNCTAEYTYLSRQPLLEQDKNQFITIQISKYSDNTPGPIPEGMNEGIAKFPITIVKRDLFESIIRERYEILCKFEEGTALHFKREPISGFGYFAKILQ